MKYVHSIFQPKHFDVCVSFIIVHCYNLRNTIQPNNNEQLESTSETQHQRTICIDLFAFRLTFEILSSGETFIQPKSDIREKMAL